MRTNIKILFRKGLEEEGELEAAKLYFDVYESRSILPSNSIIIPRYSALPFYSELETDVTNSGSNLINSYNQHLYVADIKNWYKDLGFCTPKTWFLWGDLPEGQYVVKGRTNSRKHEWKKRMFAESKESVRNIVESLLDDALINEQGLCVREYIPLETYDYGINGLPITNEWRFFLLGDKIIDYGYYWSFFEGQKPEIEPAALELVNKITNFVSDNINFYVIDIAKTLSGKWILIELNDGSMSGLSDIPADRFYKNLYNVINLR